MLSNISVYFHKNTKLERRILNGLNLSISKGEFVTLIGSNGAGKSTLFKVISGELYPDIGKVYIEGKDCTKKSVEKRSVWVSKVVQDPSQGRMFNKVCQGLKL
jgi:putative ABC transport system ATP-binding protein